MGPDPELGAMFNISAPQTALYMSVCAARVLSYAAIGLWVVAYPNRLCELVVLYVRLKSYMLYAHATPPVVVVL